MALDNSLPRHFSTVPPLQPLPVNVTPPPSGPVYLKQFSKSCVFARSLRPETQRFARTFGGRALPLVPESPASSRRSLRASET
jgi:hypothetical protein